MRGAIRGNADSLMKLAGALAAAGGGEPGPEPIPGGHTD